MMWSTAAVPVLYVLSFIPLAWADKRGYLPEPLSAQVGPVYAIPLILAADHGPPAIRDAIRHYDRFISSL